MSRELVEHGRNRRRGRRLEEGRTSVYHVISRLPFGEFYLAKPYCQEVFVKQLFRQAGFCGVEVLAYCVMSNHVHLLVRVPSRQLADKLEDDELIKRYRLLYKDDEVPESAFTLSEVKVIFKAGGHQADRLRAALKKRMHSLSRFMQELKIRFTFWYNHFNENDGTVWSKRFKSILVEDEPGVLMQIAAYIDLNPVRARIVEDPSNYRWSSYGAAIHDYRLAQKGYCRIYHEKVSWERIRSAYVELLYPRGAIAKFKTDPEKADKDRGIIPKTVLMAKFKKKEAESVSGSLFLKKMPTLTQAKVVGTPDFVDSHLNSAKSEPEKYS